VLAVIALVILLGPLVGLLIRAEWSSLADALADPAALSALRLSFTTGLIATICCAVLGFPLATVLARTKSRLVRGMRAVVLLPLVLPPMVGGLALLYLFGRNGLIGGPLAQAWGVTLPFTTPAVVIAQVFVALPFFVVTMQGALEQAGTDPEEIAATMGAGPWQTFIFVTFPRVLPGFAGAVGLTFARATGEFGATALFAGNYPGRTQTMPLAIYSAFNGGSLGTESAVALSLVLLSLAASVLVIAQLLNRRVE
jgi:molybdate transport system permease protein